MIPLQRDDILLQAKAVILCGLPYRKIDERVITRRARLGPDTSISVTYASVSDDVALPFGADRALLAWIQTKAYPRGVVSFDSIIEFLRAFDLSDSGFHYDQFQERLERLKALSIRVKVENQSEEAGLHAAPIKRWYTPKSSNELRERVREEMTGQLSLIRPRKYGFVMDPDFMKYFSANPVAMPLELMRAFHGNCLGWDFAQLIVWRCTAARQASIFPWDELVSQLGSTDSNHRRLAGKFRQTLFTIRERYPDFPAHVMEDRSGVLVDRWDPPGWTRKNELAG